MPPSASDPNDADSVAAALLPGRLLADFEREREALARALHDELGSNLTAINLDVAAVASQLADSGARARLERALRVLKEVVEIKRRLIQRLRPSMIDSLGLVPTLRMETEAFEAASGIVCAAQLDAEQSPVEPGLALAVYRTLQTVLNLIIQDARATHVDVRLHQDAARLTLHIGCDACPAGLDAAVMRELRARILFHGGHLDLPGAADGLDLALSMPAAPPRR